MQKVTQDLQQGGQVGLWPSNATVTEVGGLCPEMEPFLS